LAAPVVLVVAPYNVMVKTFVGKSFFIGADNGSMLETKSFKYFYMD
jgi:hypothetical protein